MTATRTSFRKKVEFFVRDLLDWLREQIWILIGTFFHSVRVDSAWEDEVRKAAGQGKIVHVIRTAHLLDALCLIYFSRRAGLPDIGYAYGLEQWFFRPFRWIYRFMTYQAKGVKEKLHANNVLNEDGGIIICLRRTPKTLRIRGTEMGEEALEWLVERVRNRGETIFLVPHAFLWGRRPEKHHAGMIDRFFGPRESPGVIRSVIQVIRSFRSANILACEPINLKTFVEEFPGMNEAGTLEGVLRRRLVAEIDRRRTLVTGPVVRSRYASADLIMSDPQLVEAIKERVEKKGEPEDEVRAGCRRMLDEIMPDYHYGFIDGWEVMLKAFGVFDKVFDGIYTEPEELDMVKALALKGPIVLLPGHRSHVDYILLSWVFGHISDLMVPYIAAGKNLSFWPLGWWFRGSGAFFIRRTMEEDDIYRHVLAAFIRQIVRDGQHVEIFMEGTRSRSGKVLPPKLGLFTMVLEALGELPPGKEIHFLPIAINYERVIEERSYFLEQSGRDKRGENIKGLVETQDVLASRYGRIYVRFGRPFTMDDVRGDVQSPSDHEGIRRLAYKLFYEMDRAFHITPTGLAATVLLCGPPSGVGEEDFFRDAIFYLKFAAATGKKVSHVLRPCQGLEESDVGDEGNPAWRTLREVLYHAIHLLANDDLVTMSAAGGGVYRVPEAARVRVDYYRNAFAGTMAPHMLACRSCLSYHGDEVPMADVKTSARFLSRLFKYEFVYNPYKPFEANTMDALSLLERMGFIRIDREKETVKALRADRVDRIGRLAEPLLETYYVTARTLAQSEGREISEREIVRRAFALHDRLMLERTVFKPEAVNRAAVSNCIKALRDMSVLVQLDRKKFMVSPEYARGGRLEALADHVYRFMVKEPPELRDEAAVEGR
jgi:glycerol-3-phosphate O-acyltransferase